MTRIFVGNLPLTVSEVELKSAFQKYGRVCNVLIATDRSSGQPRGFAFVSMPRFEDAEEAIARMQGVTLAGRTITVNAARDRAWNTPRMQSAVEAATSLWAKL